MARTIDEAFDQLLGRLTPTGGETISAASHRQSIEQCLRANFGMTNFFRSGSFGHGTSVSGFSDVDYFAVLPAQRLNQSSNQSLMDVAAALRARFPLTGVNVEAPAVVIPFGQSQSERQEIIPAFLHTSQGPTRIFGIPDRIGGWMGASPDAHGAYVDNIDRHFGGNKVKSLIRLMKAWKYHANVPIRSFYLEMRVAEYAATQSAILFKWDVRGTLAYLTRLQIANMNDPVGLGTIYAGFSGNEIQTIHTKLAAADSAAGQAIMAEQGGNTPLAFAYWNQVFNGSFPAYY